MKTCNICNKEFKNLGAHLKKHATKPIEQNVLDAMQNKILDMISPIEAEMQINVPLTEETVTTQPEQEPITNVNNCEYHLIMEFNNQRSECFTNNLKISILSYKPQEVLTDTFITIRKGNAEFIKRLPMLQARILLSDMQKLDIFLDTFYGLYGYPTNLISK